MRNSDRSSLRCGRVIGFAFEIINIRSYERVRSCVENSVDMQDDMLSQPPSSKLLFLEAQKMGLVRNSITRDMRARIIEMSFVFMHHAEIQRRVHRAAIYTLLVAIKCLLATTGTDKCFVTKQIIQETF